MINAINLDNQEYFTLNNELYSEYSLVLDRASGKVNVVNTPGLTNVYFYDRRTLDNLIGIKGAAKKVTLNGIYKCVDKIGDVVAVLDADDYDESNEWKILDLALPTARFKAQSLYKYFTYLACDKGNIFMIHGAGSEKSDTGEITRKFSVQLFDSNGEVDDEEIFTAQELHGALKKFVLDNPTIKALTENEDIWTIFSPVNKNFGSNNE